MGGARPRAESSTPTTLMRATRAPPPRRRHARRRRCPLDAAPRPEPLSRVYTRHQNDCALLCDLLWSAAPLGPGITRPGVARAQELPAATRDAIRQWSLGVAAAQTAAPLDKGRAAILHWHLLSFIGVPYKKEWVGGMTVSPSSRCSLASPCRPSRCPAAVTPRQRRPLLVPTRSRSRRARWAA